MGSSCYSTNKRKRFVQDNSNEINKYRCQFNEEELRNKLIEHYNNAEILKNNDSKKNYVMDLTFDQIQKYEEEKLTAYFSNKKDRFREIINNYFLRTNAEIPNNIINNLLEIEKAYDIYKEKIQNEIHNIYTDKKKFNIEYLTVMILGKSGVGKSTLINQFLKLKGGNKAKTGDGKFQTILTKAYKNKEMKFLRLVDTRGIELNQGVGAKEVQEEAEKYIKSQLNLGNMNNFVHCIWYCITGTRFEDAEINLLNSLRATYKDNNIPIIIVYTQATDDDAIVAMKKYIKEQNIKADFIQILAKKKKINGHFVYPFNLDKLLKETINKCRKALKGEMNSIMASNISKYLNNLIKEENEEKFKFAYEKICLYFVENYNNLNSDFKFKQYIIDTIFGKGIKYFLEKNIMSESSSNLINESEINTKNDQYIEFYKNTCNELIENDLSNLAYDFLDIQAKKEKETKKNILNENRRTHKDFIETTKNFLEKNFNYNGQLLYIIYLINQKYFIQNLKDNLNGLTEKLLEQNDIKKLISDCFIKKFKQFENKISENKDKLDSIFKNNVNILDNDSKDDNNNNIENDNDLPPANNIQDYPVKEQIEKPKENEDYKPKITIKMELKSIDDELEELEKEMNAKEE